MRHCCTFSELKCSGINNISVSICGRLRAGCRARIHRTRSSLQRSPVVFPSYPRFSRPYDLRRDIDSGYTSRYPGPDDLRHVGRPGPVIAPGDPQATQSVANPFPKTTAAVYGILTGLKYIGCQAFGRKSAKLCTPVVHLPVSQWLVVSGCTPRERLVRKHPF